MRKKDQSSQVWSIRGGMIKNRSKYILFICIILITSFIAAPQESGAVPDISDYTVYPPFVTSAVAPNILMVLDHSGSMQFPAYIGCDFAGYSTKRALCGTSDTATNPEYNYNSTRDYYGYFKTDKYYEYGTNKWLENATCSYVPGDVEYKIGDTSGCTSGNLLNWASMSRLDILRKVLIGGKSVSLQGNAHTLRSEGAWRTFTDNNLGCIFDIAGGSYPNLDHTLSISSTGLAGTCGYLTTWANGSSMWNKVDKFRYVYQSVSGNFDIKLLVVTPPTESGETYAKAGLDIRATTNKRSEHVMAMATNGAGLQFAYRPAYNNNTYQSGSYVLTTYPIWVRITRSGNSFTYYYSSDGTTWTNHGTQSVSLPNTVLVGMAASSYSSGTLGKAEFDEFICDVCSSDDFNDGSFDTSIWSALDINTYQPGNQVESCAGSGCPVSSISNANLKVDIPETEKSGVVQAISDKDGDGTYDDGAPRFGLMTYNSDDEGCMKSGIDGANMSSMLTALQNEPAYNGTPTGEALNEALDYYTQNNVYSGCNNNAYVQGVGSSKDPWYENGSPVTCRKSFVLLISDGEWNGSVDPVVPARLSHINDIRAMDGEQTLSHFSVYSFGYDAGGMNAMQQIGMYGGFNDYDSNTWPYDRTSYPSNSKTATLPLTPCDVGSTDPNCAEWDEDADGIPENYYQASEGDVLETSLIETISDMLKQSSSGTSVSVLATTGEGEGAIYQAYFFPEKIEGLENRKWLGYMQSLLVDQYGNLREDSDGDEALDLTTDMILEMEYDPNTGALANKYVDADADGEKDSTTPFSTSPLEDVKALWKGGKKLWETSPVNRTVFTTIDGTNTIDFSLGNSAALEPYLRAADVVESDNIINWTLGDDNTGITDSAHPDGYRKRDITINSVNNVWKLGDIVFSTPTTVGRPFENYDLLYGNAEYSEYRAKHIKRRQVVYVGANDGMLHAFNAGCFDEDNHKYYPDVDSNGNCLNSGRTLGEELWAFIPRGILPHLKWNTLPDYTHVYHVDLKPKIIDIPIFTASANHVNGWGTMLINGFRYGGKDISWTSGGTNYSSSPEYFGMDITDPLNPRLLWTFTDPDLGLSMSYPAAINVADTEYLIFGSGADNYDSSSNLTSFQSGYIFVLDLSSGTNGVISTWTEGTNFWKIATGNTTAFLADMVGIDVDIDSDVDVMYVGENYQNAGVWNSLLHRITTQKGTQSDPSQWVRSVVGDINAIAGSNDVSKKITGAPSAAMDDRANLWTFFGTGQFFGIADKNQTDSGAFYAIKDGCWDGSCTNSYTNLIDASTSTIKTDGTVSGVQGCGVGITTWTNLLEAANNCDGWAMYFANVAETTDFSGSTVMHSGERSFSKPVVLGGLVTWSTFIPGINECSYEGESNIYAVHYKTGTSYSDYVFLEQKEQTTPSNEVARVKRLGDGLPSDVSVQITKSGSIKGFAQQSTGTIIGIESLTPFSLKSGISGWKSEAIP